MNRLFPLFCLALGLALTPRPAAAEDAAPAPAATAVTNAPAAATGTNEPAKAAKEALPTTVVDPETRELKPHDIVRFQIEEDPPLAVASDSMHVSVSDGGEALFPVSRHADTYVKVTAAGRKLADIRKDVKALLDAEYYNDCTVKLDLVQINRFNNLGSDQAKVTIYGSLNQVVPIGDGEKLMLSEAILRAGGGQQGGFFNLKKVRIHRLDPNTKKELTITVDVNAVLYEGARIKDQQLQDGDRIEVRDKTFNFFN
jgi:protein involved in polysaccharide export with SLBB domain